FSLRHVVQSHQRAFPTRRSSDLIWHKSRRRFVESDPRLGLMLSGELAVLQAPLFDGLSLDPFALFDGGLGLAEVGIGGRHVVQRSEEHTSELQSRENLVCRLLLE